MTVLKAVVEAQVFLAAGRSIGLLELRLKSEQPAHLSQLAFQTQQPRADKLAHQPGHRP